MIRSASTSLASACEARGWYDVVTIIYVEVRVKRESERGRGREGEERTDKPGECTVVCHCHRKPRPRAGRNNIL